MRRVAEWAGEHQMVPRGGVYNYGNHLTPGLGEVKGYVRQTVRRVLKGETVPAEEKVVSLFEPQTAIVFPLVASRPLVLILIVATFSS